MPFEVGDTFKLHRLNGSVMILQVMSDFPFVKVRNLATQELLRWGGGKPCTHGVAEVDELDELRGD